MGALAGHLAHLHENLDFTFGELKDLLADVVAGKTPVVEKVDGQNIFFKFQVDPRRAPSARPETRATCSPVA